MSIPKILVAEDDPISSKMIQKCLDGMNLVSIASSNGRRAWDVLIDNPDISLVITDIAMPDMDGKELIKAMKDNEKLRNIPIIIVSGVVGPNQISSIISLGASRFLPKPIDISMLKEYVILLLELD